MNAFKFPSRKLATTSASPKTDADNTCILCFKTVDIFSIGECDHPVCYECSTRMRVLCEQLECPICRQGLPKVIFTTQKELYRHLEAKNRSEYYDPKYKICFYTKPMQQAFNNLLEHRCPKCNHPPFRNFATLREHVAKDHHLYYCDLCTDNLKIFSFERRCYTKSDLALHRGKGDPDNTSHRGHPLCVYCDRRYLDRDELFRHLRRDHYFCHFCDADGFNEFYKDYASLREHFRKDHYLCEEGKCATEEFTGAFRTEIDYKAHVANVHSKMLNKHQAKQARTLKLEITLGPRGRSGQNEQQIANVRSRGSDEVEEERPDTSQIIQHQRTSIDARNEQDFPSLGNAPVQTTYTLLPPPMALRTKLGSSGLARTKENFPALGGGGGGSVNGGGGGSTSSASKGRSNQKSISSVIKNNPSSSSSSGGVVIHVSNRPSTSGGKKPNTTNKHDFPALPGTSKSAGTIHEDLLPSNSNLNMHSISAKYRSLVDDYVSVANPSNFQKIQVIQKENEIARAKKLAQDASAPKLDSQDFPALPLGHHPQPTAAPSLTRSQKQREREAENRRSKVAPAPSLNTNSKQKHSVHNNNNSSTNITNNKKEKKNKNSGASIESKKSPEKHNNKQKKENNENKSFNMNVRGEALTELNPANIGLINGGDYVPRALGPPPGFEGKVVKPPPGFQDVTLNSVAKSPNHLTFTSSSGESYNIVPTHNYTHPPESVTRNQKLMSHFKDALDSPEALSEFFLISQHFREGVYKPQPYYEHCQAALKDKFYDIFPEFLALLPDISKQQALYLVHSQHMQSLPNEQKKSLPKLEVCPTCKQVLLSSDFDNHVKLHVMRDNFPTLGKVDSKGNTNRK